MKKFINLVIVIFLIYFIVNAIFGIKEDIDEESIVEIIPGVICDEYSSIDTTGVDNVIVYHNRTWNKYSYDSIYCLSYGLSNNEIGPSHEFRGGLLSRERNYEKYWRDIYYELYEHDKGRITFLQDSLEAIARKNAISKNDFAKLIVSFVQDIPYNYIVPGPCDRNDHPCRGNEKFGILSPLEFLYTLSGDCDTRSVLLYSILKHFGYNTLIMISNEYRHAMIAIDLPAAGDYIVHKGKKFYFWETTNTGWLPGMLPPDTNNISYWKITLDHEYQTFATRNY